MEIEKIVGQNVARLRGQMVPPMSQPALGTRLGEVTGKKPWTRQAVSNAENGARSFTVADLVTLAVVFEVPPAALLVIPPSIRKVVVNDHEFQRDELEDPRWQNTSTSAALVDVLATVGNLARGLDELQDRALPLWQDAQRLTAAGHVLRGQMRLEELGAASEDDHQ